LPVRAAGSPTINACQEIPMNRLPSALSACAAVLVGAALATPAAAQFAKPEDAIKYRKAAMTLEAAHFGRIAGMASGKIAFDAKTAEANAEMMALVSKWQFTGFVEGSDKGDTKAKPEIWSDSAKFQEASRKSQDAVEKLAAAVKTGSLDAIKAAVGPVGQSCKGCHDTFRKE
jgi:cytochrome c556